MADREGGDGEKEGDIAWQLSILRSRGLRERREDRVPADQR